MVERRKAETIATKWCKAKGRIGLFIEDEDKSDIEDNIDPNKANKKYL